MCSPSTERASKVAEVCSFIVYHDKPLPCRSGLHLASAEGHIELVRFMVDCGANINCQDRWGGTPLGDAQHGGHTAIAAFLQSLGALSTASDKGPTEGERMCRAAARGELDEIRRLVASSASVNAADYDRRSALHLAAAEGHAEAVRYLVAERADVQARDRWGSDPLSDAVHGGHTLVQAILVEAGAKLDDDGSIDPRAQVRAACGGIPTPAGLSLRSQVLRRRTQEKRSALKAPPSVWAEG